VVKKQVTESFLVQPTNQGTKEYEVLARNLYPGSLGLGDLGARDEAETWCKVTVPVTEMCLL
jgi:hypothetical protein